MRKLSLWLLMSVLGLSVAAIQLRAQTVTANLKGTVTDASGGVVPGATIVVHNTTTGAQRTVTSDSAGNFNATLLPLGNYTVTVTAKGFQTYTEKGIVLNVGAQRSLLVQLKPGTITQTVHVTASTVAVQTSSAAQSATITGRQVRGLMLNNRNFEQLLTLQPGVSSTQGAIVGFGLSNTTSVSINGTRPSASNWTVDGADDNDSGSNFTLLNVPSVDAISEFTLQRSTYDAEYGRSGGGQVMVVTRSGSNQFHGDAYEFVRNDKLNANDFFNNKYGRKRPPVRYNDFGFTFGGPIVKNKTFFFISEEWRRNSLPGVNTFYLPNPQELQGNFSGLVYSPSHPVPVTLNPNSAPAGCITGDQINPNCFSSNAKAYIAQSYAKISPNSCGATDLVCSLTEPINSTANYRQDIVRLDQNLGNKIQLFARYMGDSTPTTNPLGMWGGSNLPDISSSPDNSLGRNLVLHMTEEITPTIVNEVAYNYSWGGINIVNNGISSSLASWPGIDVSSFPYKDPYNRVPTVGISGLSGPNGGSNAPYFERNVDKNIYDNVSIISGNHTIHTGLTAQWMTKTENSSGGNGGFGFNGAAWYCPVCGNSNPAFANFLLGDAHSFGQGSRDIIPYLNFTNFEAYVQDDWKITPRITLNLGLRYSYFPTPHDKNGILDNLDPSLFNQAATAGLIDPATGEFVAGTGKTPANYTNGIIVGGVNSPYGSQVNPSYDSNFAPRLGFAWDVFGDGKTSVRGGYGMFYDRTLNGIWEQNQFTDPPFVASTSIANPSYSDIFDNVNAGTRVVSLFPHSLHVTGNPGFKTPYVQNWNLSVEREILPNTLFQMAYVGSNGTHLLGIMDLNQVPLTVRTANPTSDANALRPFLGYNTISAIVPEFNSNYHSLQVSLNRRINSGLNLGVAYTWSRALTNNSSDRSNAILDSYNPHLDYGPASYNRGQVLVFNYLYDLPFLRSQKGVAGHVLGGWQISGITTFETGIPVTAFQYNDPFNCYDWNGCGAGILAGTYPGGIGIDPSAVSPRPDQVGNPNSGPKTIDQWFNTSAFKDAVGHFGSASRFSINGPGLVNWDFDLLKYFQITERLRARVDGEFFNVFNHTNFNNPASNVDSSSFGKIYSDYSPRMIQLGIKLIF